MKQSSTEINLSSFLKSRKSLKKIGNEGWEQKKWDRSPVCLSLKVSSKIFNLSHFITGFLDGKGGGPSHTPFPYCP